MARRRKCGCYDGPYSKEFPKSLTSVRCHLHADIAPAPGHSLIVLDENGKCVRTKPAVKLSGDQALRHKQAKQAKMYDTGKQVKK